MNFSTELPPRARRIPTLMYWAVIPLGTTSACAENTGPGQCGGLQLRNYLRVRGEYHPRSPVTCHPRELPPRARRILHKALLIPRPVGTTSACAENTGGFRGF